jgi:hypothetical protein
VVSLYYFGCWREAGHHLHDSSGRLVHSVGPFGYFGEKLDSTFAPKDEPRAGYQDETRTSLTHYQGWTVLAMWDRSCDKRPGSNAAFVIEGEKTELEMWALASEHYPQIVARLKAAPTRTKEQVYDERIFPLMSRVLAICDEHKVAMIACFALEQPGQAPRRVLSVRRTPEFHAPEEFAVAQSLLIREEAQS